MRTAIPSPPPLIPIPDDHHYYAYLHAYERDMGHVMLGENVHHDRFLTGGERGVRCAVSMSS